MMHPEDSKIAWCSWHATLNEPLSSMGVMPRQCAGYTYYENSDDPSVEKVFALLLEMLSTGGGNAAFNLIIADLNIICINIIIYHCLCINLYLLFIYIILLQIFNLGHHAS